MLLDDRAEVFDASDSFVSTVREVLLEQITRFVAEANYLEAADEVDDLVQTVDAARCETTSELEDQGP